MRASNIRIKFNDVWFLVLKSFDHSVPSQTRARAHGYRLNIRLCQARRDGQQLRGANVQTSPGHLMIKN